jgi:hypothetical protein
MMLIRENVTSESERAIRSAGQPQAGEYLSGSFVIREVPVVLIGTQAIAAPNQATLHYAKLRVEGIESLLPDAIEVDVTAIALGGHVRVDELPMPTCCEVIGVWFANPVVTVGPPA